MYLTLFSLIMTGKVQTESCRHKWKTYNLRIMECQSGYSLVMVSFMLQGGPRRDTAAGSREEGGSSSHRPEEGRQAQRQQAEGRPLQAAQAPAQEGRAWRCRRLPHGARGLQRCSCCNLLLRPPLQATSLGLSAALMHRTHACGRGFLYRCFSTPIRPVSFW